MWQGSVDRRESSCHGTHYVFVDVLNIVSCFAVVCLHTSLGVFSLQHTFLWAFQELMQAMFIFAVPIFFMVSGMNLLDYRKKYSTKVFFKKTIRTSGTCVDSGQHRLLFIVRFAPRPVLWSAINRRWFRSCRFLQEIPHQLHHRYLLVPVFHHLFVLIDSIAFKNRP